MKVYEAISRYMDEHQLGRECVAEAALIPLSAFDEMLSGKHKIYAEDLRAICLALQVSADTFIESSSA